MAKKDFFFVIGFFAVLWCTAIIPIIQQPIGLYPVVDANWHHVWAENISHGDVFIYAPYFRAPLYPMTLGFVYKIMGSSMIYGIALSFLFGVFSVHLIHRIVYERAGRKISLIASLIWAVYGVNLFYCSTLLITPMYIFLLLFSFYLLEREKPCPIGWFVLGLAAITRPSALLLLPVALILYRNIWKKSWLFLIPILFVWIINFSNGDAGTVISSQAGINLYIGTGPDADGFTAFAVDGEAKSFTTDSLPYTDNVWVSSYAPFEEEILPSEVSAWWSRRSLKNILENPIRFLDLTGKKVLYMISPVAVPSNYDVYYFTKFSSVLKLLTGSPRFPVAGLLIWFLIPGAFAAGRLSSQEKKVLYWIAGLSIGILPFFVTARFRLPIVPFMIILLLPRFMKNMKKSFMLAPVGVIVGVILAFITSYTVEFGGVNMTFHDGVAHFENGDEQGAEILFLKAVEVAYARQDGIDLNGVDALFNLGIISIRQRNVESARMYWEMALMRNPEYLPAYQALMGLTQ